MSQERSTVEVLKAALEWYADEANYEEAVPGQEFCEQIREAVPPNDWEREWEPDDGGRAREALAAVQSAEATK